MSVNSKFQILLACAYLCSQEKKIFGNFFFPLWLYLPKPVSVPWREIGNELFNETGDPSKTHTHTHTHQLSAYILQSDKECFQAQPAPE